MKDITREWLDDADYDIQSAEAMLKSGRYFYVVFMCNLAVEKMLKAVWAETKGDTPPKVHDLIFLYESVFIEKIPEEFSALIDDLDDKSVVTRYPDGRKKIAAKLTKEYCANTLSLTKDMHEWLRKKLT